MLWGDRSTHHHPAGEDAVGVDGGDGFGEVEGAEAVLAGVDLVDALPGEVETGEPAALPMIGSGVDVKPAGALGEFAGHHTGEGEGDRVAGDDQFVFKEGFFAAVEFVANPAELLGGVFFDGDARVYAGMDEPHIAEVEVGGERSHPLNMLR